MEEPAGKGTCPMPTSRIGPERAVPRSGTTLRSGPALRFWEGRLVAGIQEVLPRLTENEYFPPAIMMAQLREHLITKEAKALIAGKTDPTETWTALNKRLGHKEFALVNIKYKLASQDTSRGDGYKKVEALLKGVNEARATMKAVGAEADLFNNVSVVAQLVAKLSALHQDRWH